MGSHLLSTLACHTPVQHLLVPTLILRKIINRPFRLHHRQGLFLDTRPVAFHPVSILVGSLCRQARVLQGILPYMGKAPAIFNPIQAELLGRDMINRYVQDHSQAHLPVMHWLTASAARRLIRRIRGALSITLSTLRRSSKGKSSQRYGRVELDSDCPETAFTTHIHRIRLIPITFHRE